MTDHRPDVRLCVGIGGVVLAATIGPTVWAWTVRDRLPDEVARHWGVADQVSGTWSLTTQLVMLGVITAMVAVGVGWSRWRSVRWPRNLHTARQPPILRRRSYLVAPSPRTPAGWTYPAGRGRWLRCWVAASPCSPCRPRSAAGWCGCSGWSAWHRLRL